MNLPKDPNILLSYINTELRDNYPSLSELSHSMDIDMDMLKSTLLKSGYSYNEEMNRFIKNDC